MPCIDITYFEAIFDAKPFEWIQKAVFHYDYYCSFLIVSLIFAAIVSFGCWIRPRAIKLLQLDLFAALFCCTYPLYYGTHFLISYFYSDALRKKDVFACTLLAINVTSLVIWIICLIQKYFQRSSYSLIPNQGHRLSFKAKIFFATILLCLEVLTVKFFFGVAPLGCVSNVKFMETQVDMLMYMFENFACIIFLADFWYQWTCGDFWIVEGKGERNVCRSEDEDEDLKPTPEWV